MILVRSLPHLQHQKLSIVAKSTDMVTENVSSLQLQKVLKDLGELKQVKGL
jgi:hypothetical protein